jgi:cytoskeletal protein CcmA (bactofilin family)
MFSKSKINEPGPKQAGSSPDQTSSAPASSDKSSNERTSMPLTSNKPKPPASTLSTDLTIVGNLRTTGDIMVEGHVQGDIRAHLLTVGEGATIEGEIVADDIVVTGRVIGRVRGLKVRLTATAKVEGDIVHKTIAIESGAHFEGSVQRQEDPLASGSGASPARLGARGAAKPSVPPRSPKPADADA